MYGPEKAQLRTAIVRANQQLRAAFQLNDARGVSLLFSENGSILPAGKFSVQGRSAIRAFCQGAFDTGIASMEHRTREIDDDHDLAYEVGAYAIRGKNRRVLDRGRYMVVWKRVNDGWQRHREMWHSRWRGSLYNTICNA